MEEQNRIQSVLNKPRVSTAKLTPEERQRRLEEMQMDATLNDNNRLQRQIVSHKHTDSKSANGSNATEEDLNKKKGTFLNEMRKSVYVNSETSMEERIERNRYYYQKGDDLDSGSSFLKK
jgi:hypothetical protein